MSWWNPKDWWDEAWDTVGMMKDSFLGVFKPGADVVYGTAAENKQVAAVREAVIEPTTTAIKGTTRQVTTALDFPIEVSKNWLAFSYNNPITRTFIFKTPATGPGFKKAEAGTIDQLYGIVRNTQLGETISDLLPGGETLEQGSGFFAGGENLRQINERKKELYPTIYGQGFTIGRLTASPLVDMGVITPESTAFQIISGTIDAGYTLAGDPVNWIPAGAGIQIGEKFIPLTIAARAGKRAKVTTTVTGWSKKIIDEAVDAGKVVMDDAGLIVTKRGKTVAPTNWEAYKFTKKGREHLESFVGDRSGTAAEIWRRSDGQIPPSTARRLEAAQTYDEVEQILDEAVYSGDAMSHVRILPGLDPRPITTKAGTVIKSGARKYRPFFELMPESTDFPLNNPVKATNNVDALMGSLKIPTDVRNNQLQTLFEAFDDSTNKSLFDWLNQFEKTIVKQTLKKYNIPEEELVRMSSWRKSFEDDLAEFVQDELGATVPLPWLIGRGENGGYGPLYLGQLLNINPTLIDPEDLMFVLDRSGKIRSKLEKARRRVVETELVARPGGKVEEVVTAVEPTIVNFPMRTFDFFGDAIDWTVSRAWKPNILMRPRYLLRALPEEMARVYATGIFEHPGQYMMQMMFGKSSTDVWGNAIRTAREASKADAKLVELERLLRKYNEIKAAGATTVGKKNIDDIIDSLMKQVDEQTKILEDYDFRVMNELDLIDDALVGSAPTAARDLMTNPAAFAVVAKRYNPSKVQRTRDPKLWAKAVSEQIAPRASNTEVRAVAGAMQQGKTTDEIVAMFQSGKLKNVLDEYIKRVGRLDTDYVWDNAGVRQYVQKIMADVELYSMGDPALLEVFATAKFNNQLIFSRYHYKSGEVSKANKELSEYILSNHELTPKAPDNVAYWPSIFEKTNVVKQMNGYWDSILAWGWRSFYGLPSDVLSRNPLWNQAKWQRVLELMPAMSPQTAAELAANARKADLPQTLIDDIDSMLKYAQGELDLEEVETLSSQFATKFTNDNMFSASKKSRFGAVHRKTLPFYDAFRELGASAFKFAMNPKVIHKADVVLGELRQNTTLLGAVDRDGDGKKDPWLYKDPRTGEEMFALPMPGFLMGEWKKNGLDLQFANTLSGLSLVTTLYPSLGPVVAFPLSKIIPDEPDFDNLKRLVAPYGIPDLADTSILQYLVPGLGQQQLQMFLGGLGFSLFEDAGEREKFGQIMLRALAATSSTKDYDPYQEGIQPPTGYSGMKEWEEDAKELAKKIYMMLGIAGAFMPGAPISQWYAKSKSGNVLLGVLQERWNQISEKGDELEFDYQDKLEAFVEEFGSEALIAFLQPVTNRTIVGSNSSRVFYDWYRENREVADKYDEVSGYFAPQSSALDPDVWFIQRLNGDVEYKDSEEFMKNVQSAMANFIFNNRVRIYEESIPPEEMIYKWRVQDLQDYKRRLQIQLKEAYPFWDRASAATEARNNRLQQVSAIREMIKEPSLKDNRVARAADEYLKFRDENVNFKMSQDPTIMEDNWWKESDKTLTLRYVLWEKGERLAEKYPEFVNLWQNVLSREFISSDIEGLTEEQIASTVGR